MSGLEKVRFDDKVSIAHSDNRREIYDPKTILGGISGRWYPHSIITILDDNVILGEHYHDYTEVFFTPTGGFNFMLADIDKLEDTKKFVLSRGSSILIPSRVAHRVFCKKNSVLIGFGSIKFDPGRIFKLNSKMASIFQKKYDV